MISQIAPLFQNIRLVVVPISCIPNHFPAFGQQELSQLRPCDVIVQFDGQVVGTVIEHPGASVTVVRVPAIVVGGLLVVLID